MPFDHLPNRPIDTSPLRLHPYIAPQRPTFPTYKVVMDALNKILPALDPLERRKRQVAMKELNLQEKQIPLQEKMLEAQSRLYDKNYNGGLPAGTKMVGGKLQPWDQSDWDRHNDHVRKMKEVSHGTENYNQVDPSQLPVDPSLPSGPLIPTEANPPQLIPPQSQFISQPLGTEIPEAT